MFKCSISWLYKPIINPSWFDSPSAFLVGPVWVRLGQLTVMSSTSVPSLFFYLNDLVVARANITISSDLYLHSEPYQGVMLFWLGLESNHPKPPYDPIATPWTRWSVCFILDFLKKILHICSFALPRRRFIFLLVLFILFCDLNIQSFPN